MIINKSKGILSCLFVNNYFLLIYGLLIVNNHELLDCMKNAFLIC